MDKYIKTLEYTIEVIAKTYMVIILVLLCTLFLCLILKNKFNTRKISMILTILLICAFLSAGVLLGPRLIDLKQNSFVTIENGRLLVDDTNSVSSGGSIMFYGFADAFTKDGSSTRLLGINFFELPSAEPNQEFYGDIVYAKYSRQIIALEESGTGSVIDTE